VRRAKIMSLVSMNCRNSNKPITNPGAVVHIESASIVPSSFL